MPLTQLDRLVSNSKYSGELRSLRIEELFQRPSPYRVDPGETDEHAVMRVFRMLEGRWLSSGFFVRFMKLERWTAQKICGELASAGMLERRGRTAGTRYRFPGSSVGDRGR